MNILNNQIINTLAIFFTNNIKKMFIPILINSVIYYFFYIFYKLNKNINFIEKYKSIIISIIDVTGKLLITSIILIVIYFVSYKLLQLNKIL